MVDAHTQCVWRAGRRHPLQKLFRFPPSLTHMRNQKPAALWQPPRRLRCGGGCGSIFFLLACIKIFALSCRPRPRESLRRGMLQVSRQLAFAGDLRGANCSLKRRCPNILSDECGARAVRAPPICMQMRRAADARPRSERIVQEREREREGHAGKLDADFRYLSLPLFEHEYVRCSKDPCVSCILVFLQLIYCHAQK